MGQTVHWKAPTTTRKWKGLAEVVMTVVTTDRKGDEPRIDVRVMRTTDHPSGAGYTREGVRMTMEDAYSLAQAIIRTVDSIKAD